MLNKTVLVALSVLMTVIFTGCETVKGVGKDIQKAGEAIEKSVSKKAKKEE